MHNIEFKKGQLKLKQKQPKFAPITIGGDKIELKKKHKVYSFTRNSFVQVSQSHGKKLCPEVVMGRNWSP